MDVCVGFYENDIPTGIILSFSYVVQLSEVPLYRKEKKTLEINFTIVEQ